MKRSVLTLFSGENDILSHILRLALVEKGIAFDVVPVSDDLDDTDRPRGKKREDYEAKATIVDRDLVISDVRIALEYLDDKFPHPALYPTNPEVKAKFRMLLKIIDEQAVPHMMDLSSSDLEKVGEAVDNLIHFVDDIQAVFDPRTSYVLNEEFTILDCYLAPLIYKLIRLSQDSKYLLPPIVADYYRRIHNREQFLTSLQLRSSRGFMYEKGK